MDGWFSHPILDWLYGFISFVTENKSLKVQRENVTELQLIVEHDPLLAKISDFIKG